MWAARWVGDGLRRAVSGAAGSLPGVSLERLRSDGDSGDTEPHPGATLQLTAEARPPRTSEAEVAGAGQGAVVASTAELSGEELTAIRLQLEAEVAQLRHELYSLDDDLAGLIADSHDGGRDDQADAGSKTFEREQEMSVSANTREVLTQAEHALDRLAEGSYGLCESCRQPIRKRRLQAFPRATLCLECKQRQESR